MPKFFIEGYGCSLNQADTQQISFFLEQNGFILSAPEDSDFAIINSCAVKQQTEFKMLKRIRSLFALSKKFGFKIIVFGCLPEINPAEITKISPAIIQIGPQLENLAKFFSLPEKRFSPLLEETEKRLVSILPISRGCLGSCSYCAVKRARGTLKSYSIEELDKKFRFLLETGAKEIWLTAQDTGCYGKDNGSSLVELLQKLLSHDGNYRLRIGMMNPNHLKQMLKEIERLLCDERLYLFLHVPVQSGSDRILKLMNRKYSVRDFETTIKKLRKKFPAITLATDIIVGFPGETKKEFDSTLFLVKRLGFDVVNVSRYGKRPFTEAAAMPKQVFGWEKKRRSRIASALSKELSEKRNRKMLGRTETILVNERGKNNSFVGRTRNYKPVVIRQNLFGKFVKVKIAKAFPTYLEGQPIAKALKAAVALPEG